MSTARFGRALAGICVTVAIVFWAVPVNAQTRSPDPAAPVSKTSPQPVRVQILVDESANVTAVQVDMQKQIAEKIAAAPLAGDYQVEVTGYGSAPREGRSAFDRTCPSRRAGPDAVRAGPVLAACITGLHKREPAEGNDSDIAGAVRFFGDALAANAPDTARLVLVLLAGGPPNARNQLAPTDLAELKNKQIEVWPLGFGSADPAGLDAIAHGGFQGSGTCERDTPSAHTAGPGEDLIPAATAVATALTPRPLCRSETKVRIPLPATDATIRVRYEDRLTFNFCEPHPAGGPQDCSDTSFVRPGEKASDGPTFERTASADGYDRLHVTHPMPGEWTIVATAPPGGPPIMIDPQVEWEGTPRTAMLVRPTPRQPGPNGGPPMVNVEARLYTRAGALQIPGALESVTAQIALDHGSGGQPAVGMRTEPRFAADSGGSDIVDFTTSVSIPQAASASLAFEATVRWPGVTGPEEAKIEYPTSVQEKVDTKKEPGPVVTLPTLDGPLPRGGSVSGYLTVAGPWGRVKEITLTTPDSWKDLGVALDTVTLRRGEIPDGKPIPLTIRATAHAKLGPVGDIIRATTFDPYSSSSPRSVGDQFVALTVVPFPADSPVNQWQVGFLGILSILGLVIIIAGVLEFQRRITRHAAVGGLKISLYRDNIACDVLEPSSPGKPTISFGIDNVDGTSRGDPSFSTDDANVSSADQSFRIRRNGQNGMIQLDRNLKGWSTHPVGEKLAHLLNERVYFIIADTTQNSPTTGATSTVEP
ncbi:vWA domain-containing protein [Frankia sp. Cas4]|uniref:vWA domain-containing protein n=1 Tax=Frankia sp. Cas4 TaxID=3073927 RepID=UPI002AD497A6|nr:vWA domain-containing protein [Frankia sp. Cas4]